eukprot:Skav210466  [mRNA]  locus=scaffold1443:148392:152755:- [translate_table: standard]
MAPARLLQCILPDVLNNEYVLYAARQALQVDPVDSMDIDSKQAIISLGWSQAWLSATVDSVLSITLANLDGDVSGAKTFSTSSVVNKHL